MPCCHIGKEPASTENSKLKPGETFRTIFVHNMFSPCFAKRRASDKDLPVFGICYFGELEIPVFSDIIPPLFESFRDEKDHNFDTKESI